MKSEQFDTFLQDDLSWRKKEISELFLLAQTNTNNETLLKSLILILYAHWEGYIKKSSKLYLKYVVEEKVIIQELTSNFKGIALKEIAKKCLVSSENLTLSNELQLLNRYSEIENKKFKINIDPHNDQETSIISTENNLKPKVLKNIINIVGSKYSTALETREVYINNNLLANRNAIGHGSKFEEEHQVDFSLTISDIAKLKDFVLIVLDFYTDMLMSYKEEKFYLVSNEGKKVAYDQQEEIKLSRKFEQILDN